MKKKNIMKTLFAGTMTLGMALSATPVFAVERTTTPPTWNEGESPEIVITKNLNVAADVINFENMTFTFNFELESDTVEEELVSDLQKFTASTTIRDNDTDTGIITNSTDNILKNKKFPTGGVYTYKITESQTGEKSPEDEYGLTCSNAEYKMKVYVKNGTSGTYIYSVTVTQMKNDEGTDVSTNENKVDATPDASGNSQFIFNNTFTKKAGGTDPDAKSLTITKEVAGDYGDKTKEFSFNINLKLPSYISKNKEFTGIVDGEGKRYTFNNSNDFTISDVKLAHDETLEFADLPAGTTYTITESQYDDYTPQIKYIQNGNEEVSLTENIKVIEQKVGENTNSVTYTNTYHDAEEIGNPTGIIINNLPFVLMVVIAGSGLALYVVSKRRAH